MSRLCISYKKKGVAPPAPNLFAAAARRRAEAKAERDAMKRSAAEDKAAQLWAEIKRIKMASVDPQEKSARFKKLHKATHLTDEMIDSIMRVFDGAESLSPFQTQRVKRP
ncbi:unnamed protein product [Vitrella brassicaformis CCMP3155]|uniref:Uncharacterized protein n=1 Tax=Vitrella brassicaformis (strain CCMP3155) TaxID=1169540 RepID=A0A0G4H7M5_VITBC|nr:unnamed protein product [Vitrella brassicaformis CCMP3155]|eukprot:CEM39906.1 unnamed protein product [Vitrella brassicaformis CCMP3155]